jgi:uncharacterized cupin superfamily protein
MSERRHPNVHNVDEAKGMERMTGARFGFQVRQLSEAAGARSLGASWYEVPPGRACFPYHFHCVNEEAVFILEGTGTARIGGERVAIRAGDWLSFPIGPDTAHQIINTGTTPLRLLAFSTKVNGDVLGYPDSKKLAGVGWKPGSKWGDQPWIRIMVAGGHENADYFLDENADEPPAPATDRMV